MEELRPGLWYWTAIHPTWYDNEVGSYAWDAGSTLVLLDPLSPPTVVEAQQRMAPLLELPVELVLTTHGEPVRENGREALRKALLQSSS